MKTIADALGVAQLNCSRHGRHLTVAPVALNYGLSRTYGTAEDVPVGQIGATLRTVTVAVAIRHTACFGDPSRVEATPEENPTVLIIDDDPALRESQQATKRLAERLVVVNDEDGRSCLRHGVCSRLIGASRPALPRLANATVAIIRLGAFV